MKRIALITSCTILFSLLATAQKNLERENFFRVGLNAGLNINKITGRSYKDEFRYNYALGGFLQFNLTDRFGLQPEIHFVQSSAEQTNDFSDIYDDLTVGGSSSQAKAKLNYLKIGGLANINVGPSKRVKLQVGPQWGLLMSENVDSLRSDAGNIFKKGEFSLAGGILIQLPLIHIGGRYELGLTNINDIDNQDKWKTQGFQLFIGVTF